jgi:hypothetical protein
MLKLMRVLEVETARISGFQCFSVSAFQYLDLEWPIDMHGVGQEGVGEAAGLGDE